MTGIETLPLHSRTPLEWGRAALADPDRSLDDTCDKVLHSMLRGHRDDEVALLLARTLVLGDDQVATWELSPEPAAVAEARAFACRTLTAWHLDDLAFAVELIVSELVTNAIRYARRPWHLRLIRDAGNVLCEASDASSTAPHLRRARVFDEGGRGLFIVAQLARRWGTRHTGTGTTIWAEVASAEPAFGNL